MSEAAWSAPSDELLGPDLEVLATAAPLEVRDVPAPAEAGGASGRPSGAAAGPPGARVDGRTWRLAWRAALGGGAGGARVLVAPGRALVVAGDRWALFDPEGAVVAELGTSPGDDVALDLARGQFLHVDGLGFVVARDLADGQSAWRVLPAGGRAFRAALLARLDGRVALAGPQRRVAGAHDPAPPVTLAQVELHAVDAAPAVDVDRVVEGPTCRARALRRAPETLFARCGEVLALASRDRVLLLDLADLRPRRALAAPGPFVPLALAADEAGRLLLVVEAAGLEVWGLTQGGERFLRAPLPPGLGSTWSPPAAGPDGRLLLAAERALAVLAPDGRVAWGRFGSTVDGALVAACGAVLATLDGAVCALDRLGNVREVARGDEPFVGPPALDPTGRLYACSARAVYAFDPVPG